MTTRRKSAKKAKPSKKAKSTKKTKAPVKRTPGMAFAVATSQTKTSQQRVKAFQEAPLAVCASDENLQKSLKVLRDRNEPIKVRWAALQALQAATFSVTAFEACREDYLAALREVADDPDPDLRRRVLGILAREKDGYAQKKLLEGLEDPKKALVPPEKALQLLSYDVHSEAYSVARDVIKNPPNDEAKREALRLLAADATAAPVFEKILRDKKELRDNRQISAAALQVLQPEKFQEQAREILLDTKEYDDIQATALTAFAQMGDEAGVAKDQKLLKRVNLMGKGKSAKVKKGARRFLNRYAK